MTITSRNPFTGKTVEEFQALSSGALEEAIARAGQGHLVNRKRRINERAARLNQAAVLLEERADALGRLITEEMGKPLKASIAEVRKCAAGCKFYAKNGATFLRDEQVVADGGEAYIRCEPIGVVLAVMPWNFPFWQVFRFAAPALMAGNAGLLKHASNVPRCAIAIESVLREAGFDAHEFQTLLIGSDQVRQVIEDERVSAVSLTGSEAAGASVASLAAAKIKKSVLELGGSDPFIVMPGVQLDRCVQTAVQARVVNNGQSCIAAKRFLIHRDVYEEFSQRFVTAMRELVLADPLDERCDIGPLAMPQIAEDLDQQVRGTLKRGARLLTGGKRSGDRNQFYEPTVIDQIPAGSPLADEETFGPVAALFPFETRDEAIRIANSVSFGLGASVWTGSHDDIEFFVDQIASGQVFINAMVASQPTLPFGGVKRSGFGRELGRSGILEFVNQKSVFISEGSAAKTGSASE